MSLKPPFTQATAYQKVKAAQALWNTQNPQAIAKAYTENSIWRNRSTFLKGHPAIVAFLTAKWVREKSYRLRKELFCFNENRIAVQFWYEYQDAKKGMGWCRTYGIEHWTFAEDGRMESRMMSGNDVRVGAGQRGGERWFGDDVADVDSVDISKQLEWIGGGVEKAGQVENGSESSQ